MKISRYLWKFRGAISFCSINTTIACISAFAILWDNANEEHTKEPSRFWPQPKLSGLNCSFDSTFLRVKTNFIWNSRVVQARGY